MLYNTKKHKQLYINNINNIRSEVLRGIEEVISYFCVVKNATFTNHQSYICKVNNPNRIQIFENQIQL